jgi:adenine deaminase
MLREGSLRQDLATTLPRFISEGISLQRLILVTDSMSPDDVEEYGHMDHVVRSAIALGLSPLQAIQSVTLNPAAYSGLEQDIGGIAPGRFADIVLIDDLEQCHVREVMIAGKVVARKGVSEVKSNAIELPANMMHSLRLGLSITPETFKISSPRMTVKIRVMELLNQTITAERVVEVGVPSGVVQANLYDDLLKVAMFDRHQGSAKVSFGILKGFGAKLGAMGLTTNLDENTLMVVGSDDHDMACCANVLLEAGGGIAIVDEGNISEKIEFPFGGIFSLHPWQEVGNELRRIQTRLKEMGSSFDKPIFALVFLPFVTLPALRITARGLIDVKARKIAPLFAD